MKIHIVCVVAGFLSLSLAMAAQTSGSSLASTQVPPPLIQFSNIAVDEGGNTLSGTANIAFSLYNTPQGGEPLWTETQNNVQLDSTGHYSVQLGITKANGVPTALFTSGEARWLGVRVAEQTEQPRVLLVSVPYALKAGDAATVGGLPPSAFVLAEGHHVAASMSAPGATIQQAGSPSTPTDVTTTGGTAKSLPVFNGTSTIINSAVTQSGGGSTTLVQVKGSGAFTGDTRVDYTGVNKGTNTPGIRFGTGNTGEAISSDREGTVNVNGIDFYTDFTPRLSITNGGNVGIGTAAPGNPLVVLTPGAAQGANGLAAVVAAGATTPVDGQATTSGGDGGDFTGGAIINGNGGFTGVGGSGVSGTGGGGQSTDTAGPGAYLQGGVGFSFGGDGADAYGGSTSGGRGGIGVYALGGSSTTFYGGVGVWAQGGTGTGGENLAGLFLGDIQVTGSITAGTKDFKIDHPSDPANKYLFHASIESSEMLNLYSGNVTLDSRGEATVQLPRWFQAENGDVRYSLTCVGAFAPVYVAEEISDNHFRIAGGRAGMKVSWQVTGTRQDAYARAHPLQVEVEKVAQEKGYYIHPELYGAPKEKGMAWSHGPQMMPKMK